MPYAPSPEPQLPAPDARSTLVLLPPLLGGEGWDDVSPPGLGSAVRVADVEAAAPYVLRWIATAAHRVDEAAGGAALLLAARGAAGALVPQLSLALRARGRRVAAYAFVDAVLPRAGATLGELADVTDGADEPVPMPADWPDAPCAYALTDPVRAQQARLARLRGWQVVDAASAADGLLAVMAAVAPR